MSSKKRQKANKTPPATPPAPVEPEKSPAAVNGDVVNAPVKWRWSVMIVSLLVLSVVVLFFSWIKLFDLIRLDQRLQQILISYADPATSKRAHGSVRTILVEKHKENPQSETPFGKGLSAHRKAHAILLKKLSEEAKAAVVVFDVHFKVEDLKVDNEFKQAIEDATRAGTKVIFGAFMQDGVYIPAFSKTLRPVIGNNWGIMDGEAKKSSNIRSVRLASPTSESDYVGVREEQVFPSIALQAVAKWRYRDHDVSYWFAPLAGQLRLRRATDGQLLESIPVNDEMYLLVKVADKAGIAGESYEHVFDNFDSYREQYEDKIVVIGYQEEDDQIVSDGQTYFGSELQANAISMLLKENYIRPLPVLFHYFTIIVLIAIGACLQIKCAKWMGHKLTIALPISLPSPFDKLNIPTAIVVIFIVYLLLAVIAYKVGHLVFDMSYHFAALLLTYTIFVYGKSRLTVS